MKSIWFESLQRLLAAHPVAYFCNPTFRGVGCSASELAHQAICHFGLKLLCTHHIQNAGEVIKDCLYGLVDGTQNAYLRNCLKEKVSAKVFSMTHR
ncbi:hypothetical protein D9M68_967130 [compost metagenome]